MLTKIETGDVSGINGVALGCGRIAKPIYGKLVLGRRGVEFYFRPLSNARTITEREIITID